MKMPIKYLIASSLFFCFSVLANPSQELNQRLNKVTDLHAHFAQQVYTAEGQLVQQGKGELWLKRPNLFRWHMTDPDESVLVSDGHALWFYNPFVEQVTINDLNRVANNTPFMLIARNQPQEWQKYTITQSGDHFTLKPKNNDHAPFEITVTPTGLIHAFVVKESDGQSTAYQLSAQSNTPSKADTFTFALPEGVTVDDQR